MCGITGLINAGDANILKRMTDVIAHRGPDDEGLQWFGDCHSGLGHRRLSIIDLSAAGHQPMSNDAGSLWITFNGEIYNYKEIRNELNGKGYIFRSNSDTEVVLKAYEEWGINCLDRFNGMFAFALYDTTTQKLFAARDRVGIKPFYYFQKQNILIFGSEIKAIIASGLVEKKADVFSLYTPTRFQISPYTGFENIYKLPPAHYLTFDKGKLEIKRYWQIKPSEDHTITESAAELRLDELLSESIDYQMVADVPVGLFLSGGIDSSIIAALMRRKVSRETNLHSFTIRFTDADQKFEQMSDDSYYARKVAREFNFNHHESIAHCDVESNLEKLIYHADEPIADPAIINTYLMSKYARENGTIVVMNGMGGDEIFGGYRKHLACLNADTYRSIIPLILRRKIESSIEKIPVASSGRGFKYIRWAKRFLSFASLDRMESFYASDLSLNQMQYEQLFSELVRYKDTHYYRSQMGNFADDKISYLTQMCLNDTKIMLSEHNLVYSDKGSMAAGVESRPPLTDHRIIEFMFSLPPKFRIRRMTQKYLLKKISGKYLEREIIHRPKAAFGAPLRSWVRGALRPMIDEYLSETSLKKRNLYDVQYVKNLIENDRNGREDNAHIIWTLLTNELWFRVFFK